MAEATLHNPDFLALDDAYRGLQRLQYLSVQCSQLDKTLQDMEQIGFVAIEIIDVKEDREGYTIKASKGKHGPCKFKGAMATYSGAALAALDDDLHLLPRGKNVAVCEKTRAILDLPAYRKLVMIKKPMADEDLVEDEDQAQKNKLDFETAVELIYSELKSVSSDTSNREMLFYPGPFRLLILNDGTLVRRGIWNSVPSGVRQQFRGKDRFFSRKDVTFVKAEFLQELYPEKGSSILLGDQTKLQQEIVEYTTDLHSLVLVKEPLRGRLLRLIAEEKKYFLLVGNEASDTFGCCPSEEVTEANKLVRSGILDAFREPVTGDSCPVTMYAFRDEMTLTKEGLAGKPDSAFRAEVLKRLKKSDYSKLHFYLKWMLIAFVAISFLAGIRKCYQQQFGDAVTQVTLERINPEGKFQAVLVLFHNQKRCYQCLEMETLSHAVLGENPGDTNSIQSVGFSTLVIDEPASEELVDQFGIFAATLVLIDYTDPGKPIGKVLTKAPELYRDREAFTQYLKSELEIYLD